MAEYPLMFHWHERLKNTVMHINWFYVNTNKSFPYTPEQQSSIIELMKSNDHERIKNAISDMMSQTEDKILNAIFKNEQFLTQDLKV